MDIPLNQDTLERLSALAVAQKSSVEVIASQLLARTARHEAEKVDDFARLQNMRENGGIPHNEMMDWLGDIAAGKNV